jgi:hypothetical protein
VAIRDLGLTETDESLRNGLDELLTLSDASLSRLGSVLSDPGSTIPRSFSELKRLSAQTEIEFKVLYRTMPAIRYLLAAWRKAALSLEEMFDDLRANGFSEEKAERSRLLLSSLEAVKEKYFVHSLVTRVELVGAPTVDDLNLVWDVRSIFAEASERDDESETEWVGSTYVLLMEISASRRDGQQESTTIQFSEQDFEQFERVVGRARRQLEMLKTKTFN